MKKRSLNKTNLQRFLAFVTCVAFLTLVSSEGLCRRKRNCELDGEVIVETTPNPKPAWVTNKVHFAKGRYDYFIGISTQNKKPENGKHMAILEAKTSFMQHMGELIQQKEQGRMTLTETDWQNLWGSLKAPTLISDMTLEEWYFEKVATYKNCRPKYHYDVRVLIKMPKAAVDAEKQKALEYLRSAQKTEIARQQNALLPKMELSKPGNKYAKSASYSSYDKDIVKSTSSYSSDIPKKGNHFILWTIVSVVVLGGLAGGLYVLGSKSKSSKSGGTGDVYISGPTY